MRLGEWYPLTSDLLMQGWEKVERKNKPPYYVFNSPQRCAHMPAVRVYHRQAPFTLPAFDTAVRPRQEGVGRTEDMRDREAGAETRDVLLRRATGVQP